MDKKNLQAEIKAIGISERSRRTDRKNEPFGN